MAAVSQQILNVTKRPVKTALHQAVLDHRIHQVRLLVDKHGGNVDSKDMFGRTPLMLACLLENEEYGYKMMKIFLRAGAYVNLSDNMNRSALHYACMKGRVAIVRRLVTEESVSLNAPDNDDNTPLIHAALSGFPEIVALLVEVLNRFGISVENRNCMGYSPLLMACKYGHYVSAHILLTQGHAHPSIRDNEFFFNAMEWVAKSDVLHATYSLQQHSHTQAPPSEIPRFSRENTMYRQFEPPTCNHTRNPIHPLGQSIDSALRLPALFSSHTANYRQETNLNGADAKRLLIAEIKEATTKKKYRPQSRVSRMSMFTRSAVTTTQAPSTAKLAAFSADRKRPHVMFPDMRTLFKLYSEQYVDQRAALSAPACYDRSPAVAADPAHDVYEFVTVKEPSTPASTARG